MKKVLSLLIMFVCLGAAGAFAQGLYTVNVDNYKNLQSLGAGSSVYQMNDVVLDSDQLSVSIYENYNLYIFPAEGCSLGQITIGGQPANVDWSNIDSEGYAMIAYSELAGNSAYAIDITTNGPAGGNDDNIVYTFNCNADVLSFSCYGVDLTTSYADGSYTVTGDFQENYYQSIEIVCTSSDYEIKSIKDASGNEISYNYGWRISVDDYFANTTFNVVVEEISAGSGVTYIINCPEDVLQFSENYTFASLLNATYADGAYTLTVPAAGPSIYVGIKSSAEGYTVTGATIGSVSLPVNDDTMFAIYTSQYPEGATVEVEIAAPSAVTVYTINCPQDVLEFSENYLFSSLLDVTYADGAYTVSVEGIGDPDFPSIYGRLTEEAIADNYRITGVTVDGVAYTGSINEGQMFSISTYIYPKATTFDVEIEVVTPSTATVYTINCPQDVLEFSENYLFSSLLDVTYADGAYTVSVEGISETDYPSIYGRLTEEAIADNYRITGVTVDGVDYTGSINEGQMFSISSYTYPESTTFDVELGVSKTFYVACAEDVLVFGGKLGGSSAPEVQDIFPVPYADGIYTVTTTLPGVAVGLNSEAAEAGYTVKEVAYDDPEVTGTIRVMFNCFTFNTSTYANGTTFDVTIEAPVKAVDYIFECAEDVLEFGSAVDYSDLTITEYYEAIYADGAYTVSIPQSGPSIYVALTAEALEEGYVINAATVDGEALPGEIQDGRIFSFPTYLYQDGATCVVDASVDVPAEPVFTFVCADDVLRFASDYQFQNAIEAEYVDGAYVLDIEEDSLDSIYVGLTEEAIASNYIITSVNAGEVEVNVYEGISFSVSPASFALGTVFNVTVKEAKVINFACVEDVLEFGTGIATVDGAPVLDQTFAVAYVDGVYSVKAANNYYVGLSPEAIEAGYSITGVTGFNPNQIVMGRLFSVGINNFENGTDLEVSLNVPEKVTYTYTFEGVEGLLIQHGSQVAVYADGVYTLADVDAETRNYNSVEVSVADDYKAEISLVSVVGNETTYEPMGATGIIYVYNLPESDCNYVVNTEVAAPGVEERTVYLTIDDVTAANYWIYQAEGASYQAFDDNGEAELTINARQFVVEIVTNKPVLAITTDVENTFTVPTLPSSDVILNLSDCVEGQTIRLFTSEESGVGVVEAVAADAEVYTLQGVRVKNVKNLQPGIYIVAGKKVVVK